MKPFLMRVDKIDEKVMHATIHPSALKDVLGYGMFGAVLGSSTVALRGPILLSESGNAPWLDGDALVLAQDLESQISAACDRATAAYRELAELRATREAEDEDGRIEMSPELRAKGERDVERGDLTREAVLVTTERLLRVTKECFSVDALRAVQKGAKDNA